MEKNKWTLDAAHTEIGFKVKHLMVTNVRGHFTEFDSSIYTTGDDFTTAEIDFWLSPASLTTGNEKRDEHLRSADFFDTEKFKEIHFTGNTIEKTTEDKFELFGELSIKDVKKQIKLQVEFGGIVKDPWGGHRAGFTITGKINRKDWGLHWNTVMEAGGVVVGEDVSIICEVELTKQS